MLHRSVSFKSAWDDAYKTRRRTAWEMIELSDLRDFIFQNIRNPHELKSAIEFGCGRSLRTFIALLGIEGLNRPDFSYVGLDLSRRAISVAKLIRNALKEGKQHFLFSENLNRFVGCPLPLLKCDVRFVETNLFDLTCKLNSPHDMIIDWMCFHDLHPALYDAYISLVATHCRQYLLLKIFSKEGATISELGEAVPGLMKRSFSQCEIERLFCHHFRIVKFQQDTEDLHPCPPPADGIVAAKRAYLLQRL